MNALFLSKTKHTHLFPSQYECGIHLVHSHTCPYHASPQSSVSHCQLPKDRKQLLVREEGQRESLQPVNLGGK